MNNDRYFRSVEWDGGYWLVECEADGTPQKTYCCSSTPSAGLDFLGWMFIDDVDSPPADFTYVNWYEIHALERGRKSSLEVFTCDPEEFDSEREFYDSVREEYQGNWRL